METVMVVAETTDAQVAQSQPDHRLLVVQLLRVAAAYRRTCIRALEQAHAVIALPSSAPNNNNSEAEEVEGQPPPPPVPFVRVDPSDPVGALEVLRSFDHDGLLEAITKTGRTIRKWRMRCKGYRERSKGKISFRNFAVGDLALFLPTRNSPWAAFNGT
jgi:autophagy-related protein 11